MVWAGFCAVSHANWMIWCRLAGTFSAERLSNGDNQRMEELHSHRIRSRAAMRVDKEWKGLASNSNASKIHIIHVFMIQLLSDYRTIES